MFGSIARFSISFIFSLAVLLADCAAGSSPVTFLSARNGSDQIVINACLNSSGVLQLINSPSITSPTITNPVITGASTSLPAGDTYVFVPPSDCWMSAATTAFAAGSPSLSRAAANNVVLSATTNTTGGTLAVTCGLDGALSRITSGKGFQVTSVNLLYGVQTTALSSIAAATLATVTYPAAGGAASGTVASAGGSLTVTPGTLQLATTTAGQCYVEQLSLGTPYTYNLATNARFSVDQVFTTAGTTATTLQVCGALVVGTFTYL